MTEPPDRTRAEVAPWGLRDDERTFPIDPRVHQSSRPLLIGGGCAMFALPLLLPVVAEAFDLEPLFRNHAAYVPLLIVAMVGTFALFAHRLARTANREAVVKALADKLNREPRVAASNAAEGVCRVGGIVSVVAPTRTDDGRAVASYEARSTSGYGARARSRGGIFALDDGSGTRTIVRAEHVRVYHRPDESPGASWSFTDGDEVEVLGRARWSSDDHAGLRAQARVLEIDGTVETPVIVRIIARAGNARPHTDRVRVTVDASERAPTAADARADSPSAGRTEAHRG